MRRHHFVVVSFGLLGISGVVWRTTGQEEVVQPAAERQVQARTPRSAQTLNIQGAQGPSTPDAQDPGAWLDEELMVRARSGVDLAQLAQDYGTRLRRAPGHGGYAAMLVPPGQTRDGLMQALEEDARVADVARMGRVVGAGSSKGDCSKTSSSPRASDYQWHLNSADVDTSGDYSGILVAVLDTGVAYENYSDSSGTYVQAQSLSGTSFVAPYDFVNDDAHPNDDNQHGTHITSVIASDGAVMGVAPGASILPVKVLNADNSGAEIDLVDAIYHAVDNGADVINMSLTFSAAYTPSSAMREALEYAADAGVVMVAAGGNDSTQMGLFPASSPLVIGVGASSLKNKKGDLELSWYSNLSPALDLMAPGGDVTQDKNKDGYADGVLAETFDPSDPSDLGYWFYAGTSQAAAIVTGAVVQLLDAGLSGGEEVRVALQQGADDNYGSKAFLNGGGAGDVQVGGAVDVAEHAVSHGSTLASDPIFVTLMPYLEDAKGDKVRPALRLNAVNGDGSPVSSGTRLVGTLWTADGESTYWCKTDSKGVCTAYADKVKAVDRSGAELPLAYGFTVDAVVDGSNNLSQAPMAALWVTPELVWWTEAMDVSGVLEDHLIAVWWQAEKDPDLGKLAEAFSVADLGTGRATLPAAVLFNETAVAGIASWDTVAVDLDGTGLTTDPLGIGPILLPRLTLDMSSYSGGGLTTDPLGFTTLKLLTFSGSGLTTDPLGFKPPSMYDLSLRGSGLTTDPLGVGTPLLKLSSGTLSSGSLSSYAMGDLIAAGGWLAGAEYQAASLLLSSGAVVDLGASATLSTGGLSSVEF